MKAPGELVKVTDLDILAWHRGEEQSCQEAAEDYRDPSEGSAEYNEIMVGVSEELAAMHGRFVAELEATDARLREADALVRRMAATWHSIVAPEIASPGTIGADAAAYVARHPA